MELTLPVRPDPGAPTRRLPCLVVVRGQDEGRVLPIQRASLVLGRDRKAGIQLEDKGISRKHARFKIEQGRVCLEDMGSTNGSWCNGKRVKFAKLTDGDRLQFGACSLAFRMNHPEEGRLLRILYHRATRDPLTALFNRTSLEDRLDREVERQKRYQHGLGVVQLDLDHFKRINDSYSHAVGDLVLKAVARAMRSCLRSCDLAARVGGEEFILVLPECNQAQVRAIAEKVRARVAKLKLTYKGKTIPVTASLGGAVAVDDKVIAVELLAEADSACYRAKRAGRNRVC